MLFDVGRVGRQSPGKTRSITDPGIYTSPSLDLDFMSGALDPRITFSRAVGPATYVDAAGIVQNAGTNVPRFGYDPVTHALRGLLIEEARTNLMLQSGDFTNAAWTKGSCTLAAGIPGPNGPTTGSAIIASNAAVGFLSQNYTSVAGTTITASAFVKAANSTQAQILIPGALWNDAVNRSALFNLATGSVTSASGGTASGAITPFDGGWYRISLTATPDKVATVAPQLCRTVVNGDGVTTQLYAFGAQLEAGAFLTSYIPTTAATATRAADQASIPTAAWFNASASSLMAEYMVSMSLPDTGAHDACVLSDGTTNNNMALRGARPNTTNAMFYTAVAGSSTNSSSTNNVTPLAVMRLAAAWDGANPIGALNGTVFGPHAKGMPTGINLLTIGNQIPASTTACLDGWIRRVQYWNRALSDTELQTITR